MEYFLGSVITFALVFFTTKIISLNSFSNDRLVVRYSQSHIHSIVSPVLPPQEVLKAPRKSQSMELEAKTNIKVIIVDGQAYWIKDNSFFVADLEGKNVNGSTARIVDTIHMDKVQLDKMLFIMDKLRDGKSHDSGSAGDK
jgi:hypothetical protein